jgi:hypothetical protein
MLLAAAGVEYTDVRAVDANHKSTGNPGEVPAESVADTMDWNLGRMPICEADGVAIGQGGSIARFLASTYGLNGASLVERGQIDSICEALGELKSAFRGAEDKALFFDDETAGDYSGVAVRETRPQPPARDRRRLVAVARGRDDLQHAQGEQPTGGVAGHGRRASLPVRGHEGQGGRAACGPPEIVGHL